MLPLVSTSTCSSKMPIPSSHIVSSAAWDSSLKWSDGLSCKLREMESFICESFERSRHDLSWNIAISCSLYLTSTLQWFTSKQVLNPALMTQEHAVIAQIKPSPACSGQYLSQMDSRSLLQSGWLQQGQPMLIPSITTDCRHPGKINKHTFEVRNNWYFTFDIIGVGVYPTA